jgi:predicted aldo/keto reductase-like oxidoreductase
VEKVALGKTGMRITRVGLGGIPIQRLSEDQAVLVVRRTLDSGLNWIDTAHGYSNSETRIGKAIKGYDRGQLHLFTKSPAREAETIREHIDLSLECLGTEYIDLFQFHNVPNHRVWKQMQSNGALECVNEYQSRGIIRHIGASSHFEHVALELIEHPCLEVLQYPFNFIVEAEGRRVLDACVEKEIGFIAMKPFGGGMLEAASICIRFLLQFSEIVTDPGFDRIEQVDEVVDLYTENAPLSTEDQKHMERLRKELGKKFCRRCGYCLPCEQGVDIITLMNMESYIKRFPKDKLAAFPAKAAESSVKCIECGECEKRCPYELPIVVRIKQGADAVNKILRSSV